MIRVEIEMSVPNHGNPVAQVATSLSDAIRLVLHDELPSAVIHRVTFEEADA